MTATDWNRRMDEAPRDKPLRLLDRRVMQGKWDGDGWVSLIDPHVKLRPVAWKPWPSAQPNHPA